MNQWIESEDGYQWRGDSAMAGAWAIRFRDVTPGLYFRPAGRDSWYGPFLGVLGLTARGRGECGNLTAASITHIETHRERIELEFQPPDWFETTLRFTWSCTAPHQFDLLAEISTRSVGMLFGVEVGVVSSAWSVPESVAEWLLAVRDEPASMRSIDGREPRFNAQGVAFGIDETVSGYGPDREWPPTLLTSVDDGIRFLETAHPHDISRRYRSADGRTVRTWTLGYDLERGIILRARFRSRFLDSVEQADWTAINAWKESFLNAPLPLER